MSLDSDIEENKQLEQQNIDLLKKRWKYSRVPQRESVYCVGQVLNINLDFFLISSETVQTIYVASVHTCLHSHMEHCKVLEEIT